MHKMTSELTRQLIAAAVLSAIAVGALVGAAGRAGAADLSADAAATYREQRVAVAACDGTGETVVLYDEDGKPTAPARTPYYYCVTGTTLLPGQIPPPPDYCCH